MNIFETIWDFIMKHDEETLKEVFPEWMDSDKSIDYHYTQKEAMERIRKYERSLKEEKKESCNGCPFLPYCEEHAWNSVDEVVKDACFNAFLNDLCEKTLGCNRCPFDEVCSESEFLISMWPDDLLKECFQKYRKCEDRKTKIEERKDLYFHLGIVMSLDTGMKFYAILNSDYESCFTIWTPGNAGHYAMKKFKKTEYSFEDTGLVLDKDILRTGFWRE